MWFHAIRDANKMSMTSIIAFIFYYEIIDLIFVGIIKKRRTPDNKNILVLLF